MDRPRSLYCKAGFVDFPRRGVVECFFARINRNRMFATDFEATIDSARAILYAASITIIRGIAVES
jgi:transposase